MGFGNGIVELICSLSNYPLIMPSILGKYLLIRSRGYANEIGELFEDDIWNRSIGDYKRLLRSNADFCKSLVSDNAGEWLDLLSFSNARKNSSIPNIKFRLNIKIQSDVLIVRKINGYQYFISPDLSFIQKITLEGVDFSKVSNVLGIEFRREAARDDWKMPVQNPYVHVIED